MDRLAAKGYNKIQTGQLRPVAATKTILACQNAFVYSTRFSMEPNLHDIAEDYYTYIGFILFFTEN